MSADYENLSEDQSGKGDEQSFTFDQRFGTPPAPAADGGQAPPAWLSDALEFAPQPGSAGPTTQGSTAADGEDPFLKRLRLQNEGIMKERRKATEDYLADRKKDMADLPSHPQLDKAPKAPQANMVQGMMEYMQLAAALSALAGGLARRGGTVALNAFSGAVKGFVEGKKEVFASKLEEWKAAAKEVQDNNQAKLDEYDRIWKDKKLSMDEKLESFKIVSAQYGDEISYNLSEGRDYTTLAMRLEREKQLQLQMVQSQERLQRQADDHKMKIDEVQRRRDNAKDIADGIRSGINPPTSQYMGSLLNRQDVMADLDRSGFNTSRSLMLWNAAQKNIGALNSPQMTRFVSLTHSVLPLIDDIKGTAEELRQSGVPLINKGVLDGILATNANSKQGQLAQEYITKLGALKSEGANLETGGYAPIADAWKVVDSQISSDMGWRQLESSLTALQQVFNYRINAIDNLKTYGPGAANPYTGNPGHPAVSGENSGWGELQVQ